MGCCGDCTEPVGVLRVSASEALRRAGLRPPSAKPYLPPRRGQPKRGHRPVHGPLGDVFPGGPLGDVFGRVGQTTSTSSSSSSSGTQATTDTLTPTGSSITWTPNNATQYAQQTDQVWQALNTAVVSCTSSTPMQSGATSSGTGQGLTSQQFSLFQQDYIAWEGFYQLAQNADASSPVGISTDGLWWNDDKISLYQGKATAWYNTIQAACPNATLPTLQPATSTSSFLSNLFQPSADTVKALTVAAVVGTGLWFAWPWLARLRKFA